MQEVKNITIKTEIDGTLYIVESIHSETAVPVFHRKIKRLILQSLKNINNSKIS